MVCLGELIRNLTDLLKHQIWVLYYHVVAKGQLVQGGFKAGT